MAIAEGSSFEAISCWTPWAIAVPFHLLDLPRKVEENSG